MSSGKTGFIDSLPPTAALLGHAEWWDTRSSEYLVDRESLAKERGPPARVK